MGNCVEVQNQGKDKVKDGEMLQKRADGQAKGNGAASDFFTFVDPNEPTQIFRSQLKKAAGQDLKEVPS